MSRDPAPPSDTGRSPGPDADASPPAAPRPQPSRRTVLEGVAGLVATGLVGGARPAHARPPTSDDDPRPGPTHTATAADRPALDLGVMTGDVWDGEGLVWSHTDRPARMLVRWDVGRLREASRRVRGPVARPDTDHTAQTRLRSLPPDATIAYEVRFEDLATGKLSEPTVGTFRTGPAHARTVRFQWGADLAGQGWGIDEARGGYRIFDTMRARRPEFLLFCGDRVYADQPLPTTIPLPDGTVWRNRVTEAKRDVAQTLQQLRGTYRYNHLDGPFRRYLAEVPLVATWDDHEVVDNWWPGRWLSDERYASHDGARLASRARRAFGEYTPLRRQGLDWARLYRHMPHGPLLDVFVTDTRSHRARNSDNRHPHPSVDAAWMGRRQLSWLKRRLARSTATWKVIVVAQPLGVTIWHDWATRTGHDGVANGEGPPMGREHEIESLLRFLRRKGLRNVVFLAADVHYAAAHHYHPDRAVFRGFDPFWEFVAGPLHAGTFGPGTLDPTFGPEAVFTAHAPADAPGLGPWGGRQYFGEVEIDGEDAGLTVRLIDTAGTVLHTQRLAPAPR